MGVLSHARDPLLRQRHWPVHQRGHGQMVLPARVDVAKQRAPGSRPRSSVQRHGRVHPFGPGAYDIAAITCDLRSLHALIDNSEETPSYALRNPNATITYQCE